MSLGACVYRHVHDSTSCATGHLGSPILGGMGHGPPLPPPPNKPKRNRKSTWALVFGILGFWPLFVIGSVVALVLGYAGKKEIDRSGGTQGGRSLAIAGIVLGWVVVGVMALLIAACSTGSQCA